jgi:predicted TIM-barrel fold metal-dependent hydrolase
MRHYVTEAIDADGHVVETRRALEAYGWRGKATGLIDEMLSWDREDWGDWIRTTSARATVDIDARLEDQASEGIDHSVNYPTPLLGISDFPDTGSAISACSAYNDWFHAVWHKPSRGRMTGAALVPLRDATAAAHEAERAINELGAVAVLVQPYVGDDIHLCDAQFDSLWAVCERYGKPAAIHGSRHTCAPKLAAHNFRNAARFYAISHPFQQQVAMGDLVLGGVLERYPRLKLVFLESGVGWMPHYIDRLDEAYQTVRVDWINQEFALRAKPSEYLLSGNCYFSCEPDEPHLDFYVRCLGEDQVVYASDYPHYDAKCPDSVRILIEDGGLPAQTLMKVAGGNAQRLYGL